MNREEIIDLMVEVFSEINKSMALASGMEETEVNNFMEQSTPSIHHALTAVYDVLAEKELVK
jgi:hypothetical protein